MKKFISFLCILSAVVLMVSCGGEKKGNGFVGSFTDEFGNKFELKEDYSATIQFVGEKDVQKSKWSDGEKHDHPYATIEFNGDPSYYYLRDGALYRDRSDMESGDCAIKIKYDD